MAGLFAINRRIHVDDAGIPLGELRDLHRGAVGDFLIQAQQQLLPHDLAHHLPFRLIAGLAIGEELRSFLGVFAQLLHQIIQTAAGMGRDGNDGVKAVPNLIVCRNHRQQLRRLHGVNLVDAQHAGNPLFPNAVNQGLLRRAHMGNGLHQQQCAVHVGKAGGHHLDHVLAQGGTGLVEAGRIHQDILGILPVHHTVDPVPGGLGLVGDNGHLLPHQGVGQAGLAHIGPSAHGNHRDIFDLTHRSSSTFFEHFYLLPAGLTTAAGLGILIGLFRCRVEQGRLFPHR